MTADLNRFSTGTEAARGDKMALGGLRLERLWRPTLIERGEALRMLHFSFRLNRTDEPVFRRSAPQPDAYLRRV
jgi:hypothetical protein